jgi:DNA polymerase phi
MHALEILWQGQVSSGLCWPAFLRACYCMQVEECLPRSAHRAAYACGLLLMAWSDVDALLQEYVLHRLVKGLGSAQGAARQGFSAALACLLRQFEEITPKQVLTKAEEVLVRSGGLKPSVRFPLPECKRACEYTIGVL